jgi:UDP-N-acetylglucosamine--N-acetylmuramyl-(pentapeptide) pyrophosphoryl-undecaprenol N-acetylglucosamine transferase
MSASSKLACVIAAGGTAGHVRPALAVGEALRERGLTVTFAGTPDRVESRLVPEAGFPLDTFPVSGLPRKPSAAQIRAAWRASAAPAHCLRILARRRPDVVLGAGGYVAGPMVLAARLRGVPAALTEADAHLGLANRLAAPFAKRLFLAYEIPGRNSARVRVVGRPIPVAHLVGSRESGRELFGLPPTGPVVGVFGAYVGALSINEMAVEAWAAAGPAVIHQAGERDFARVTSRVARDDYVVIEATDDFGELLRCVDLAVSRAGGTVWELAAAGTPAILVPYPYATADHQTLNARHFERGGGAIVVPDADVDRVPALVDELLAAPERLAAMRRAMLSLARPDAADVIADELVALAEDREASVS